MSLIPELKRAAHTYQHTSSTLVALTILSADVTVYAGSIAVSLYATGWAVRASAIAINGLSIALLFIVAHDVSRKLDVFADAEPRDRTYQFPALDVPVLVVGIGTQPPAPRADQSQTNGLRVEAVLSGRIPSPPDMAARARTRVSVGARVGLVQFS